MITPPSLTGLKQRLDRILQLAIHNNIATSVSLFVGFDSDDSDQDLCLHYGLLGRDMTSASTIYDLASLTKILGTTLVIARLVSEGKIKVDDRPFAAWPHITIKMILAHTAGLAAHHHFYDHLRLSHNDFLKNRELILKHLFTLPTNPPSALRVYSDLGFIALGDWLAKKFQKPLGKIFEETWDLLGIDHFSYFPSKSLTYQSDQKLVAPTGLCSVRKILVRAQVHDANCYFLGGLGGHAGLFGNLSEVKKIGQYFLHALKEPVTPTEKTLQHFAHSALGFDRPDSRGTNRNLSNSAVGHFGFTGVSLWMDPDAYERGVIIALLTNRVHCDAKNSQGIYWLRLAINQAIYRE